MLLPLAPETDIAHVIVQPDGTEIFISGLAWLNVREPTGLGIPRLTSQEDWVPERSPLQHGNNIALLKVPPREWELPIDLLPQRSRGELEDRMWDLVSIFNPILSTPRPFQVPLPFTYRRIGPKGDVYEIEFFYRSGLDGLPDASPDNELYNLVVHLFSPDPFITGDEIYETVTSTTLAITGGGVKWWRTKEFTYSGTAHGGFEIFTNAAPAVGFFMYDVAENYYYVFKHGSYPGDGWGGGIITITFDSRQRTVIESTVGVLSEHSKEASGDSDWNDMLMEPGKTFRFGVITPDTVGSAPTVHVRYDERQIGILV